MTPTQTNWYVVTGGPCSGKTTLLNVLRGRGYRTHEETARQLIERGIAEGKTIDEIRASETAFQEEVFKMKVSLENRLREDELQFLDRGIPDSIGYYRLTGDDVSDVVEASRKRRYKGVFLLEQVPFAKDGIRTEDRDRAHEISALIRRAYEDLDYHIIDVPLSSVEERAEHVFKLVMEQFE